MRDIYKIVKIKILLKQLKFNKQNVKNKIYLHQVRQIMLLNYDYFNFITVINEYYFAIIYVLLILIY